MSIDPSLASLLSISIAIATFFLGRISSARNSGQTDGEFRADIKYLRETVDMLRDEWKEANVQAIITTLGNTREDVGRNRESIRRLHERIDHHLQAEHGINIKSA